MSDEINSPLLVEWGVAAAPLPGQTESGDGHFVQPLPHGALAAVVDGLGHGPEAAIAARLAVATLGLHASEPVAALVRSCHEALGGTRGVTLSAATFDARQNTMTWLSVGDVEGVLLRGDPHARPVKEHLMQRGGVVGYQLPPLHPAVFSVAPGDTLVFATDGVRSGFADHRLRLEDPPRTIAEGILAGYGRKTDDALVLVVRYLGGAA